MNDYTALKFLLAHGAFVIAILRVDKARAIIEGLKAGNLPAVIGESNETTPYGASCWAVSVKDILATHAISIESLMQPQPGQVPGLPPGRIGPGGSGYIPPSFNIAQ